MSLDELSRGLANDTITRRRALAVLAASVVGAMIPFARGEAQPGCRHRGHPCEGDQDCCGDLVCRGNPDRRCRRPRNGGGGIGVYAGPALLLLGKAREGVRGVVLKMYIEEVVLQAGEVLPTDQKEDVSWM